MATRAQAGTVVQQSLSQIRTVAAYNGEEAAAQQYDAKLELPQKVCMCCGCCCVCWLLAACWLSVCCC
jgi:hypothetical protein